MEDEMTAEPLPYEMGNVGDILKHGLLAEFAKWWIESYSDKTRPMHFYDPFGGRPWKESPDPEVVRRIGELSDFAIATAQNEFSTRYFGSGHVVKNVAESLRSDGEGAKVFASDSDKAAKKDLIKFGLAEIVVDGFDADDGLTILQPTVLRQIKNPDLILIDPLGDYIVEQAELIFSLVANASSEVEVAIVIYALIEDQESDAAKYFGDAKEKFLKDAWILSCPQLSKTQCLKGESKYASEVILYAPTHLKHPKAKELKTTLTAYAKKLKDVIDNRIELLPKDVFE
jgi:hypothetical protein